jgi:hypothetical protein
MGFSVRFDRFKQSFVFAGLALSLLAAGSDPFLGADEVDAAKKKKAPNVAIESISFEDHEDAGHRYVVVEVSNIGNRAAKNFRVEMVAKDHDGDLRAPAYSDLLNIPKGGSEEVIFKLGCGWLHNGLVTVTTDLNPAPGEVKIGNNTLAEDHGICLIHTTT